MFQHGCAVCCIMCSAPCRAGRCIPASQPCPAGRSAQAPRATGPQVLSQRQRHTTHWLHSNETEMKLSTQEHNASETRHAMSLAGASDCTASHADRRGAGGGRPPAGTTTISCRRPVGKHTAQACLWACGLWRRPNRRAEAKPAHLAPMRHQAPPVATCQRPNPHSSRNAANGGRRGLHMQR